MVGVLADDIAIEAPRVLDQLPEEAWGFGPLFILALVALLFVFGILTYGVRVSIHLMRELIAAIKAHLEKNEAADEKLALTLTAVDIRLQGMQNGNAGKGGNG